MGELWHEECCSRATEAQHDEALKMKYELVRFRPAEEEDGRDRKLRAFTFRRASALMTPILDLHSSLISMADTPVRTAFG